MEECQHVEVSQGPATGFKPPNGPKGDQGVLESFPGRGVPERSECSTFDGSDIQGTGTPTVSECDQQLLGSLPNHINIRGSKFSMSDVPHMTGAATPLPAIEEPREGGDDRHNTLNLLGTWTAEGEQVFHCQPSAACNANYVKAITRPFDYIMSLLGKNVRSQLLSAFNVWLQVDEKSYNVIDKVIGMLHNASLL